MPNRFDTLDSIVMILGTLVFFVCAVMLARSGEEIRKRLPPSLQEGGTSKIVTSIYAYDSYIPKETQREYFLAHVMSGCLLLFGLIYTLLRGYYVGAMFFPLPTLGFGIHLFDDYSRYKKH